ncbi:MAG: phosphate ABC transporter substrate-binding protein PstS [Candidatus Omnitrophica bacterium]|nr:phosphate ABC transporter substrate-binding protein PstS [Candidatus Omnitrophota bacterium]
MKRRVLRIITVVLAVIGLTVGTALADKLLLVNGAGATFPYPLYSKWFYEYTKVDESVNFNYQSIGSGGGIRQITAQTVDFGASDGALTDEQLKQAPGELLHIPMIAGAVVITYNLPQINQALRFSPEVVADIYLGKISKWNDPRIVSDNPGVNLPSQNIIVSHRSDGSGTTNIFTDYLSSVSKAWKNSVGKGTSVNWPVGLGGKGNEGVAGLVKQTQGAIGYVELAYAVKNNLPCAEIKNKSGNFIKPSIESTTAAVNGKINSMPADFRVSLVNPDGADAYPIAGLTWILVYKNQPDKVKGEKIVKFLRWAVTDGQKYSADLLYAPLPESLVKQIEEKIKQISY